MSPLITAISAHLGALWEAAGTTDYVPGGAPPLRYPMRTGAIGVSLAEAESRTFFAGIRTAVEQLCVTKKEVFTVSGHPNHLLGFDRAAGVLVGTKRSPKGAWVPP